MDFDIRTIITGIFLFTGCFLMVVASIGVLRLPDFYTRMHAAGKVDTLGQLFILVGLIIYSGFTMVSVKIMLIIGLIFVINPTSSHFLAKAAYVKGLRPWEKGCTDTEYCLLEEEPVREAAATREDKMPG